MGLDEKVEALKHRVKARKAELEKKLHETAAKSAERGDQMKKDAKKRLEELKEMTASGWENISEATVDRLNKWLSSDDEKQKKTSS